MEKSPYSFFDNFTKSNSSLITFLYSVYISMKNFNMDYILLYLTSYNI